MFSLSEIASADTSALASYCLNYFVLVCSGMIISFRGLNACFQRRHGTLVFFSYFIFKAALWATADTLYAFRLNSGTFDIAWAVLNAVMAPLTFAVIYYTWSSSFLKVGLIGLLVDYLGGMTVLASVNVVGAVLQDPYVNGFSGSFGVRTVVSFVVILALFDLLLRLLLPLLKWIASYEFKHERVWAILLVSAISINAATKILSVGIRQEALPLSLLMMLASMVIIAVHIVIRNRDAKAMERYLADAKLLVGKYDAVMVEESLFVEERRAELERFARQISRIGDQAVQGQLKTHLDRLREQCASLRFGRYSENAALDAVLAVFEERLASSNVPVAYHVSPLPHGSVRVAMCAQVALAWIHDVVSSDVNGRVRPSHGGVRRKADEALGVPVTVRVFSSANQRILTFTFPSSKKVRFPKQRLLERIGSAATTVMEGFEGGVANVRLMVEEERV